MKYFILASLNYATQFRHLLAFNDVQTNKKFDRDIRKQSTITTENCKNLINTKG